MLQNKTLFFHKHLATTSSAALLKVPFISLTPDVESPSVLDQTILIRPSVLGKNVVAFYYICKTNPHTTLK